ncbi:hypothetical protein F4825DRAFT_403842 [Nemania diffusa]|nr:hypothetical protein F4825DRAFT_403842 [Nemania diffusa]
MSDIRARRQNNSCDQCRRSKKACDGYWVNNGGRFLLDARDGILPCSYCVKTRKRCSLNLHWAAQSETSPLYTFEGNFLSERGIESHNTFITPIDSGDTLSFLQTPLPNNCVLDWNVPLPGFRTAVSEGSTFRSFDAEPSLGIDFYAGALGSSATPTNYLEEYVSPQPYVRSASQIADLDNLSTISRVSQPHSTSTNRGCSSKSTHHRRNSFRKNYRTRQRSTDGSDRLLASVSPSCNSEGPSTRFNNHLITESLLRIYHDVLENNLECWLAEDTCPYNMRPRLQLPLCSFLDTAVSMSDGASSAANRGIVRSNSIYHRVKLLDRVAQSTGLIRLTHSENQAASKALDLVIMAFATQWAQGRRRRETMFSTSLDELDQSEDMTDDFEDEFEQNLQNSVWEQAKKALQDVADLESYRIVYAELIFGLIQKPRATSDYTRVGAPGSSKNSSFGDIKSSLPDIIHIMSQDGPPIYTERAGRKMQALKFHFEANETGMLRAIFTYTSQQQRDAISKMTSEERGTIGQLYWLAVMFDTVSSSMNERPVALSDEECQPDATYSSSATLERPASYRWSLGFFAQDNPEKPSILSWPCAYDSAVKAINRSAAVKVLLFRYVSYLQNTLRRRERGLVIEEIIQSATQIYRYWNVTHGAFFRSLIKNYDSVPVRVKSWFPCIHIPWHLGALMFADLIEFVDQNGLGSEEASLNRLSISLSKRIRKSSAVELADLARVTTPQDISSMPTEQLPGYHFAVNEGSILTEPWTVLLIRAFTKASIYHLNVAEDLRRQDWAVLGQESEELKESLRRCDTCVKALWFLGKKSEMARSLSKVLSGVLRSQEGEYTSEEAPS